METFVEQQPAVRVLMVEDNDAQRQLLIDLICDEGFDTVVCRTAADARVQVEDALRESEQRFRFIFAHNPLSMWVYDRDTHAFLDVNDAELVNLATHAKNFFR